MKKLARKRLFDVEKKGIDVDVGAGPGMENAIISSTQHREGYKVVTDIIVDLGTSKDTLKTGGTTVGMPVGAEDEASAAQLSYIAQLTPAIFGTVTQVETICLEEPSDGVLAGSTANAYQLEIGDNDGKIGVAVGNPVTIHADLNSIGDAVGTHRLTFANDGTMVANSLASKYVYIATGAGGNAAVGTATAIITVNAADLTNFEAAKSKLVLKNASGTPVTFVADAAVDHAVGADAKIPLGGAPADANEIAQGISLSIHANANFTTDATSRGGTSNVITVTTNAAGVGGNQTNDFVDAEFKTAEIVVGNFTGGTTSGTSTAMTQGKFLIRVTGFLAPDDL